jgi:hypothetical protein
MLRDFRIHNKFTLNKDNALLHIGGRKKKSYQPLAGNEKLSCVSISFLQYLDECLLHSSSSEFTSMAIKFYFHILSLFLCT